MKGKICCLCSNFLPDDPDHQHGKRLCTKCIAARQPPLRNIYMYYMFSNDWYCQSLEADLKTPLPRKFRFSASEKVIELAERGRGLKDLACKQALEHGIGIGRGGIHLYLTDDQYNKLKRGLCVRRPLVKGA
jgi:hypothetical protein